MTSKKLSELEAGSRAVLNEHTTNWIRPQNQGDNIQNAIDKAQDAGGGTVYVAAGEHFYDYKINLWSNVVLRMEAATNLRCTADDYALEVYDNAAVIGGRISSDSTGLDGKGVVLFHADGTKRFSNGAVSGLYRLVIRVNNSNNETFGLHLKADEAVVGSTDAAAVAYCNFDSIRFLRTHTAIRIDCSEADSPIGGFQSWCNANHFTNIIIGGNRSIYGIVAANSSTGTPAITGNQFQNITFQSDSQTLRFLKCGQWFLRNRVVGHVWDWQQTNGGNPLAPLELGNNLAFSPNEANYFHLMSLNNWLDQQLAEVPGNSKDTIFFGGSDVHGWRTNTGGTGSAGPGNQHLVMQVGPTQWKILHDGEV